MRILPRLDYSGIYSEQAALSHLFTLLILFWYHQKPFYKTPLPSELDQTLVKPNKRFTSAGNTSNPFLDVIFTGITDPSQINMLTKYIVPLSALLMWLQKWSLLLIFIEAILIKGRKLRNKDHVFKQIII